MKTYKINTEHIIYVDSYEQGELNQVNAYSLDKEIKAESPKQAIEKYFKDFLYYSFSWAGAVLPHEEEETEEKNILHYSVLVDEENCEASETEVNDWKQEEKVLYHNDIFLTIHELKEVEIIY